MKCLILLPLVFGIGCARTDIYWPSNGKDVVVDGRGRVNRHHNRAIVLNGSDALGATHVRLAGNTLEFSTAGGIDNSTSTREAYRTIRYGIGAATIAASTIGVANVAANAYGSQQATQAASNVAASRAAAATAASKSAETIRLAEIAAAEAAAKAAAQAAPAAGSTINAITPAIVTPVP